MNSIIQFSWMHLSRVEGNGNPIPVLCELRQYATNCEARCVSLQPSPTGRVKMMKQHHFREGLFQLEKGLASFLCKKLLPVNLGQLCKPASLILDITSLQQVG